MKITTIINIIAASITTISIVIIIILGTILYSKNVELRMIKQEQHHLSQTVKQLQDEEIRKSEIIQEKEQLLQDLKQAKNWSEVCKIWSKL